MSAWLFPRLLALVYGVAVSSWLRQAEGLIGPDGVAPMRQWFPALRQWLEQQGLTGFWSAPGLFWFSQSMDLHFWVCLAGLLMAALVMAGVAQGPLLLLLWAVYLSLCQAGQVFMGYQWDALLLEAGLLGAILAPWRLWSPPRVLQLPSRTALFALHLLLFRLMFFSGWVKHSSGDSTWAAFTALRFHYETQPLPTALGWYAHQLSPAWQVFSCRAMFVIELGFPFLIFLGRWPRALAAAGFILLNSLILLTGNYTFFNWLTIFLSLLLLDDALWPRRWRGAWLRGNISRVRGWGSHWRTACLLPLLLAAVVTEARRWDVRDPATGQLTRSLAPAPLRSAVEHAAAFRSVNDYGLFAVMTTERVEISIEVCDASGEWKEYPFRYKPGDTAQRPPFIAPHQPRLDWQMWFAALRGPYRMPEDTLNSQTAWVSRFVECLLREQPAVASLLGPSPLQPGEIRKLRMKFHRYHFTDSATRQSTGHWWTREDAGIYFPEVQLNTAPPATAEAQ